MSHNPTRTTLLALDRSTGEASIASAYDPVYEYKPYIIRCYTHQDILEIGSTIHLKLLEDFAADKKSCIEKAISTVWLQVELQKEEAEKKVLEQAKVEQKHLLSEAEREAGKESEYAIQEAVDKTKSEMCEHLEWELKKAYEHAEQKLADGIQQTLRRCSEEKSVAIEQVKQQERNIAYEAQLCMEKAFIQQNQEVLKLAAKEHLKNMQQLKEENHLELVIAVADAHRQEQKKTQEMLQEQELKHQAQMEAVKIQLTRAETCLTEIMAKLGSVASFKEELEAELEETRQAFQKFINLTFPKLAPGQADFILPFRRKRQEADDKQETAETSFEKQV